MISKKIHNLFLIAVVLFIAHGLEEYFTGFYKVDSLFHFAFRFYDNMKVSQATFLVFQIMLWVLLILSYLLIYQRQWVLYLLAIPGLVCVAEFHHLVKAAVRMAYYPGSITALILIIFGYFYWKEWMRLFKSKEQL